MVYQQMSRTSAPVEWLPCNEFVLSSAARMRTHGRRKGGQGGQGPPWILKFSAKKVVFLVSSGKNQISPLLTPLEKSPSALPPEKNPSDAHVRTQPVLAFCFVITMLITTWCSLVRTAPQP